MPKTKSNTPSLTQLLLWESDDYIAINKPPGISSLEDRHVDVNIRALAQAYTEDPQLCHRLDKETSGVLLIAKNPEAYRHLSIQLERREVEKVYQAVVDGVHATEPVKIEVPLSTSSSGRVRTDFSTGKPSETLIRTNTNYRYHTLMDCKPLTGRTHQIRAHLAYFGAPISGDGLYGGKPVFLSQIKKKFNLKKGEEEKPLFNRVALHAFSFSFTDLSGENVCVEAPYPKDFRALLNQLGKNA